jgi:hypothetical protein
MVKEVAPELVSERRPPACLAPPEQFEPQGRASMAI